MKNYFYSLMAACGRLIRKLVPSTPTPSKSSTQKMEQSGTSSLDPSSISLVAISPKPVIKKRTIGKPKRLPKKCLMTGKINMTEEEAKKKEKTYGKFNQNNYMRGYCCEFCGNWHLTHKRRHKY